jgi:diguanylate cyclase (GGDEF)-like protein
MDHWFSDFGWGLAVDLGWPTIVALAGVLLFLLLGVYAGLLLNNDHLPRYLRLPHPATLRGRLILAFTLVAILPAVSLALVLSERASQQRIERSATALQAQADDIAHTLQYLLDVTRSAISVAANHIQREGEFTSESLGGWLQLHHAAQPGLRSMLVVSGDGAVTAATVRGSGAPSPYAGPPLRVRENDPVYRALSAGQPHASGTVSDPLSGSPAILVSMPLRAPDGSLWGVVAAVLDQSSLSALEPWVTDLTTELIVTDAENRILYASEGSGFRALQQVAPGMLARRAGTFGIQANGADGATTRFIGATSQLDNGWRVQRYRPYATVRAALLEEYAVAFGWLVAALVISLCLAIALAGSVAGPLHALDRAVNDFDFDMDQELPRPPPDAPREISAIFERLSAVVARLRTVHNQLRQALKQGERLRSELTNVIGNRETDIRNRTEELRRANVALEHMTRVDALTGAANRRSLAEFVERAWRTAIREQQPLSLIVIDIDHFRDYNEASGQEKGDTCLKAVADAIREIASRASDLVCRYGGEEFVIVLGNTPLDGALAVAEQIRAAVEALAIPHRSAPGHGVLTVSAGVTSVVPARHSQPEGVLAAAERALHTAKELGRNQVAYSTTARTGLYQSLCLPNDVSSARTS